MLEYGQFSKVGSRFISQPYKQHPKRDSNLENYPHGPVVAVPWSHDAGTRGPLEGFALRLGLAKLLNEGIDQNRTRAPSIIRFRLLNQRVLGPLLGTSLTKPKTSRRRPSGTWLLAPGTLLERRESAEVDLTTTTLNDINPALPHNKEYTMP